MKLCSIVPPVGKGRVEHKLYVEQPPTVVKVTSKSLGRLDWKRLSATQTKSIFSSFRTSQSSSLCSGTMVTQFKCGLIGDTHLGPLFSAALIFCNQNGNVSKLLLKQEWLFHVTTNTQFVFHSSLTNWRDNTTKSHLYLTTFSNPVQCYCSVLLTIISSSVHSSPVQSSPAIVDGLKEAT